MNLEKPSLEDFKKILSDIYALKSLPQENILLDALDRCTDILSTEDSLYRPVFKQKKDCKQTGGFLSGGLLDFSQDKNKKPVIVIPDLHGRDFFLMDILNFKLDINGKKITVLEALENDMIYAVSLGDLFHSEGRGALRWQEASKKFYEKNEHDNNELTEEMLENLRLLLLVLNLKMRFRKNFHILKGNHENVLNEWKDGNFPFYKFAREGEMVYSFLEEVYDGALIYLISCFEKALPICAVFSNLVLSHSEPKVPVTKKMIVEYRKKTSVIEWLTWTRNGDAEDFSVESSIHNLIKKNPESAVWISGHRPVLEKYALRQNGKLIQIHNPDFENIAFVVPEKTFNPETDIFCVGD